MWWYLWPKITFKTVQEFPTVSLDFIKQGRRKNKSPPPPKKKKKSKKNQQVEKSTGKCGEKKSNLLYRWIFGTEWTLGLWRGISPSIMWSLHLLPRVPYFLNIRPYEFMEKPQNKRNDNTGDANHLYAVFSPMLWLSSASGSCNSYA